MKWSEQKEVKPNYFKKQCSSLSFKLAWSTQQASSMYSRQGTSQFGPTLGR